MNKQSFFLLVLIGLVATTALSAQNKPKIGLALSGGGAKGVAHIGVLKVLEKEGIPVHFIGGTSAGSIVGALYSMGYSAGEIEHLALTLDWGQFISDKANRKDVILDLKEVDDKTFLSFPFEDFKFSLPSSIVPGHKITNYFSEIMLPSYQYKDFSKLPIPFLCIAADAITGEEVELKSGDLAYAVRASMAIPSVVSPVEIDGRMLIDGGVVNNFPVKNVKNMGADVVIGVDLRGTQPEKEELENMLSLIMQTIFYHSEEVAEENAKAADILIKCDMTGFSTGSFDAIPAIIKRGEEAAEKALPEIRALLGYTQAPYTEIVRNVLPEVDSMYLNSVTINGNERNTRKYVYNSLEVKNNEWVTVKDINTSIRHLYATQNFEYVFYHMNPTKDGKVDLFLDLKEKKSDYLNVGLHYDRDLDAAILFNLLSRNLFVKNSILTADFRISNNPEFNLNYFVYTGFKTAFGVRMRATKSENFLYLNDKKEGLIKSGELQTAGLVRFTILPSLEVGIGGEIEYYELNNEFGAINEFTIKNTMFNPFAYLEKDTYDDLYFPTSGGRVFGQFKSVNELSYSLSVDGPVNLPDNEVSYFGLVNFHYSRAFALSKNFVMIPRLNFGTTIDYKGADNQDVFKYHFFLGGETYKYTQIIPFPGLKLLQQWDTNLLSLSIENQYNFSGNTYLMLKGGVGQVQNSLEQVLSFNDELTYGYSIGIANKTPIGPVELAMVGSNKNEGPDFTVTIGLRF